MASRLFKQFCFSHIPMLTYIEGTVKFGATGSVAAYAGSGITSVQRLATGQYQINLTDPFNRLLSSAYAMNAAPSGSSVSDGSFVAGTVYEITSVGTTNWTAAGLNSANTPATGMVFAAATANAGGNGTAAVMIPSGISMVEVTGNAQTMVGVNAPYVTLQTLGPSASGNTTLVPTSPVSGSKMEISLFFRNSSLKGPGE